MTDPARSHLESVAEFLDPVPLGPEGSTEGNVHRIAFAAIAAIAALAEEQRTANLLAYLGSDYTVTIPTDLHDIITKRLGL